MIRTKFSQRTLALFALIPAVLVIAVLFLALPWLKTIPDAVAMAIVIPIALAIVAWGLFVAVLGARNEDEVQRASGRFAVQYGFIGGSVVVALLLLVPAFPDFITATANSIATAADGDTDKAPVLGFIGGVVTLTLAQSLCALVLGVYWWNSRSR